MTALKPRKENQMTNTTQPDYRNSGNKAVKIPERGKGPAPVPKPIKKDS